MLSTDDVRHMVIACLAETTGRSTRDIDVDLDLTGIGLDSLSFLRLQILLEDKFQICLPEDIDIDTTTGQDIIKMLQMEKALPM